MTTTFFSMLGRREPEGELSPHRRKSWIERIITEKREFRLPPDFAALSSASCRRTAACYIRLRIAFENQTQSVFVETTAMTEERLRAIEHERDDMLTGLCNHQGVPTWRACSAHRPGWAMRAHDASTR